MGFMLLDLLVFYVMFCRSHCLSFFCLVIVLSVPLRYTTFDCPFGSFKLFMVDHMGSGVVVGILID